MLLATQQNEGFLDKAPIMIILEHAPWYAAESFCVCGGEGGGR